MSQVLISAELADLLDVDLLAGHDITWLAPGAPVPAGNFAAVIPSIPRTIGPAELDRLPKLQVVANFTMGVDNLDLAALGKRRVIVTNSPDVLTEATADLAWTLILAACRRVKEGQEFVRTGDWSGFHPTLLLGRELRGATLGIIGAGRIGQAVGRRALGFGMSILYTARSQKGDFEDEVGARRSSLGDLLAESAVVSIHIPLSPDTTGLIDLDALRSMRPGGVLVNTARGGIVDESALLAVLDDGHLFAAGLDVFVGEPEVNPSLIAHPRVICLPHLGSATRHARVAMANLAARNVAAVLAGEEPITPVHR